MLLKFDSLTTSIIVTLKVEYLFKQVIKRLLQMLGFTLSQMIKKEEDLNFS